MRYALLIYTKPGEYEGLSAAERESVTGEYMEIAGRGDVVGGAQLEDVESATTVRVNGSESLTTDGPFADTKEILGGFFLVEADDIDAALEIAARVPAARLGGCVEVRPIVEQPS